MTYTRNWKSAALSLTLLGFLLPCVGCNGLIATVIVRSPNHGKSFEKTKPATEGKLHGLGVERELRVAVGPPDATLRVWVMEPRGKQSADDRPRGTILQLHGYRNESYWMRGTARDLTDAGYRVVMVDLRGHGGSSGDYITYGVCESRDLSRVIDRLQSEDLIVGKLGVWGISMGGSTAIQLAARDERVSAVVAVAPYTTLRDVVPGLVRKMLPLYGWFMSDKAIRDCVDAAGKKGGFDPDEADCVSAIREDPDKTPVLILHGKWDLIVPFEHGRRLHEAAPDHSELVDLGLRGHLLAHFSDAVTDNSVRWFDKHLGDKP